jgi:hypothetical protein
LTPFQETANRALKRLQPPEIHLVLLSIRQTLGWALDRGDDESPVDSTLRLANIAQPKTRSRSRSDQGKGKAAAKRQ